MIQRQFPILVIQSPSLYFTSGFEYCSYKTIQIIHNNAHYWILLSSFNGDVKNFDSLNTDPTTETLQQMQQLFSPDDTFPQYQLSPCHKQVGTTDCGVFSIAYSTDIIFGNNLSEIVYDQSKLRQHLVNFFDKGTLTTFLKYKCNVKYNDTTTSGPISSDDHHRWLIPCRSAHLKKRLANTTPIETTNNFSSLMNNSKSTVHAIKNLNDNNIQDDLPLTKKPSRTSKNFDDWIIFNILEKQLSPSEKSVLEKDLNFCPETLGYNKLKLMDDLFWFCRNLRLREFFHENTETSTNNNSAIYNKTQERTDMSKQLKNRSFHAPKEHCDKPTNIFHQ